MATYRYKGTDPIEVPALGIHLTEGTTFEVPDEFAARFDADPDFTSSRVQHPDVTPDVPADVPAQASV